MCHKNNLVVHIGYQQSMKKILNAHVIKPYFSFFLAKILEIHVKTWLNVFNFSTEFMMLFGCFYHFASL